MNKLNSEELLVLYFNFTQYRDNVCNGWANMSVSEFYNHFGLGVYHALQS